MRCTPSLALAALCLLFASPLAGQDLDVQRQVNESRLRLEEIRAERERLQRELDQARFGANDAAFELGIIERQLSASRSVLAEIDLQLALANHAAEQTLRDLQHARERHQDATTILHQRLRDVYKLGPLHTVRVLLGADSFVDLVHRYRYLRMIAGYDRTLLERVSGLERDLRAQNEALQSNVSDLDRLRRAQETEVAELQSIESARQFALNGYRSQESSAMERLEVVERDEVRMRTLIDAIETRRLEEERQTAAPTPTPEPRASLLRAEEAPFGWPVMGTILYRFGVERRADGTTVRRNGLGIAAAPGSPVYAVREGTVSLAGPFEGYGATVVLSHGDGMYTLYLHLGELAVVEGRPIEAGQLVGTVGGRSAPEVPHIEFQIRAPATPGALPQPLDPLPWLPPPPAVLR